MSLSADLQVHTPVRLSHLAYVTHDVAATVDFYTRVMRMPLVEAVMHERVPSTGDPFPYVHFFFRMQDGSTIAFFEAVVLTSRARWTKTRYMSCGTISSRTRLTLSARST